MCRNLKLSHSSGSYRRERGIESQVMRILHLLSQKPSDTGSGITTQAIIREASRKGHENFLIAGVAAGECPAVPSIPRDSCLYVEFESDSFPFSIVGMSDAMPYRSTRFCDLTADQLISYMARFREMLLEAIEKFHPDIIHSNHLWILTSIAREAAPHIPLLATCHGSDLRQFHLCPGLRKIVLAGCSKIDAVLALSDAQREEVIRLYGLPPEKVEIVGIGYREDLFVNAPKSSQGPVSILYAGKLSRAKGVLWLIKSLQKIVDLPWHLDIAGSGAGPEEEEILREASLLGERVTFHGALPQKALAELMKKAHIFVLPSFYEGFPLVLIEALACGCSVVATELPAVREILTAGSLSDRITPVPLPGMTGPDTPVEGELPLFTERLSQSLRVQIMKSGEESPLISSEIRHILENFTWTRVFARVERIYERITNIQSGKKRNNQVSGRNFKRVEK